jgi:chromosome segregation protein
LRKNVQKKSCVTEQIQSEVDAMNQVYKVKREEVFQLKKSLEIKEIQLSTLKLELEKSTSDSTEQSESLVEFENKIRENKSELEEKTGNWMKLRSRRSSIFQELNLRRKPSK